MSAKIYLCNKIERLPIYSVTTDSNGNLIPKTGLNWIPVSEAIGQFEESIKDSDGGIIAVQKLNVNCELTTDESKELANVPHIFQLRFSDASVHIWGSLLVPVKTTSILGIKLQKQLSLERLSLNLEF